MLSRCGTVIATDREQSIIKVDSERCDNCVGLCIRFGVPDEVASDQRFEVGQRVRVMASSSVLTLASSAIFGLPVLCFLFTYLLTAEISIAIASFCVGLVAGFAACRRKLMGDRLKLHIELQDS